MNFNKVEFEAAFGTLSQIPESTVTEIAFAGRSNVGKSSMLNKLFNRKNLARVSSVPGKTITINFYQVDEVNFVDSASENRGSSSESTYNPYAEQTPTFSSTKDEAPKFEQMVDDDDLPF